MKLRIAAVIGGLLLVGCARTPSTDVRVGDSVSVDSSAIYAIRVRGHVTKNPEIWWAVGVEKRDCTVSAVEGRDIMVACGEKPVPTEDLMSASELREKAAGYRQEADDMEARYGPYRADAWGAENMFIGYLATPPGLRAEADRLEAKALKARDNSVLIGYSGLDEKKP